jgi:hypothetical protein
MEQERGSSNCHRHRGTDCGHMNYSIFCEVAISLSICSMHYTLLPCFFTTSHSVFSCFIVIIVIWLQDKWGAHRDIRWRLASATSLIRLASNVLLYICSFRFVVVAVMWLFCIHTLLSLYLFISSSVSIVEYLHFITFLGTLIFVLFGNDFA